MKKLSVGILVIALCISLLVGCSGVNVTGRYTSEDGDTYDFNGHGSVAVTLDGETVDGYTYAMEGSNVLVYEPDYDHETGGETDNILIVSGKTLTDKDGTIFTKAK